MEVSRSLLKGNVVKEALLVATVEKVAYQNPKGRPDDPNTCPGK